MNIPEKLAERLHRLGIGHQIYEKRTRKCILSREPLQLERVPWYEHAYFFPDDDSEKDYLVFDPVSIIPCIALDPKKEESVFDMCAAPGTKTFIISFMTENKANITANDISGLRILRLRENVKKFSINCVITNESGRKIAGSFDKILLDAPCSGEGMVNKFEKMARHWSEKRIRLLARKQKKLIQHAFEILRPGGVLVYSTCTFAPEENEGVVDFLLKKNEAASVETFGANIRHAHGLAEWDGKIFDRGVKNCVRIYPHHNGTGGFFVAKIRKQAYPSQLDIH